MCLGTPKIDKIKILKKRRGYMSREIQLTEIKFFMFYHIFYPFVTKTHALEEAIQMALLHD